MPYTDKTKPNKEDVSALFSEFAETRSPELRQRLIESHQHMISFFVKRFGGHSDISEDISQVATLGLINAVDRFDPERHVEFATFATITIMGEIKRFFRDKTWSINVPRRIKDLNIVINKTIERLSSELSHPPTYEEIAKSVGCAVEDIIEAHDALQSYHVVSLDKEINTESGEGSSTLSDMIGSVDRKIDNLSDRLSLQTALKQLKDDEKLVIYNRYFGGLSQAQIASTLGVSQMQVSRLQSTALNKLKSILSR